MLKNELERLGIGASRSTANPGIQGKGKGKRKGKEKEYGNNIREEVSRSILPSSSSTTTTTSLGNFCYYCHVFSGITIHCSYPNCTHSYHINCHYMAGGYLSIPRYTEYIGGGEHEITSYCVKHAKMMDCGYENEMAQVVECMMRNKVRKNSNADAEVQRLVLEQLSSSSPSSPLPVKLSPLMQVCNVCGEGYSCSPLGMEFTIKHHDLKHPSGYAIMLKESKKTGNAKIGGIFGIAIIYI